MILYSVAKKRSKFGRALKRSGGFLASSNTKKVMAGLGSAYAGEKIGNAIGINKLIPSAALGYFTAGGIGLVTAVAAEFLTGQLGGLSGLGTQNQSTPAGTVYN